MEKYIRAEMQITEFEREDVVTASLVEPTLGNDDTEIITPY